MIESPHTIDDSSIAHDPHHILRELRDFTSSRQADAALLGEADVDPDQLRSFFGDGDEMHLLYNFFLNNFLFLAFALRKAEPLRRAFRLLPSIPESGQWVTFLRNLDELDLERLDENEREAVYHAFAPDPDMKIFGRGIRRRVAPMLNDRRRLEVAFSLLFSLPGTPLIIYGDEIGMGEDLSLKGRNAVRTPMQWSREPQAGFSTAAPEALTAPVIAEGAFGYQQVNVEAQKADPESLLNWIKRVIRVRRQCPEWGSGIVQTFDTAEPSLLGHRGEWRGRRVLAIHNLADKTCSIRLDRETDTSFMPLLSSRPHASEESPTLEVEPYGYRWYRIVPRRDPAGC